MQPTRTALLCHGEVNLGIPNTPGATSWGTEDTLNYQHTAGNHLGILSLFKLSSVHVAANSLLIFGQGWALQGILGRLVGTLGAAQPPAAGGGSGDRPVSSISQCGLMRSTLAAEFLPERFQGL